MRDLFISGPMAQVKFTPSKVRRFRRAYKKAVADKADIFVFEGLRFVPSYAKYLLEYLDSVGEPQ